jgi:hypothetical protein
MIREIAYYLFGAGCMIFCFAALWVILAMAEALMS